MSFIYRRINANMHTPLFVYKALKAKFLLESASMESGKGRFSIILRDLNFGISKDADSYRFHDFNENKVYSHIPKHLIRDGLDIEKLDFLSISNILKDSFEKIPKELESLPLPFGGLGYVSYEFFSECEKFNFSKKPLYDAPTAMLVFPRECIVFDHLYDEMYLVIATPKESDINVKDCMDRLENEVLHLSSQHRANTQKTLDNLALQSSIVYEDSREYYEKHVEIIKEEIYKGTFLQCVLSRALSIQSNMNPMYFYEELRRNNPSPYMYYLDFDDFKIIGASPEVMLRCDMGRQILRPIAGTRRRGNDVMEDRELELNLLADEKENAEHLMLVDLGRNDIGKCSKVGSVKLEQFRVVEKYSKVMHIVSQVSGEIESNKTSIDCFKACFPAGTVSGAPKIEAIKRLNSYEPHGRGIYSGAIMLFKQNGDLNSAITLRSAVFKDGIYYLQAGAGIVLDSIPHNEYIETCSKMEALRSILID